MKSIIYLSALAAISILSVSAAPTPEAGRTYISYGALGADRVPGRGGAATPANPYNRGCTPEERCSRDTGKRSEDGAAADLEDEPVEIRPVVLPGPEKRTVISDGALGADRVPKGNGGSSQANPYNRGCTKEQRCWRDTGRRSMEEEGDVVEVDER
jgi:hypothetical protein